MVTVVEKINAKGCPRIYKLGPMPTYCICYKENPSAILKSVTVEAIDFDAALFAFKTQVKPDFKLEIIAIKKNL